MSPIVYIMEPVERRAVEARAATARRIRALRERAGWDIAELAGRAGITTEMMSAIERNEIDVGLSELWCVGRALGVALSALLPNDHGM